MAFKVSFSEAAAQDLEELFNFALQRELDRETGDLDIPVRALQAIRDGIGFLQTSTFACRKTGLSPFSRELIILFGRPGYVLLFEIVGGDHVVVGAVRHQREDDYH
jgi:plasmid stabilization system protein ParE